MKKIIFLLAAAYSTVPAIAQESKRNYHADSLLSRWVIDVNLLGGGASQMFTSANTDANYPNSLNTNTGQLKYRNGYSYGGDAQLGFFFGKKRHFGIGAGIMYMQQNGDAVLNDYHTEYEATDGAGNVYRQVVTGNDVREQVVSTNINVPLVLKYKNRFSKHWGFTADAGALFNLEMKNAYTTYANFDYGAIYKFAESTDGGTVSVYDNAPVASSNDWFITKGEFLKNNPNGNYQAYVDAKRALGYNVGEGLSPGTRTGKTSYTTGSVGFILQPSFAYYLSDNVALNFGVYYMFQPFKNNAQSGYRLTDGMGTYNSTMNNVTASVNQQYGINLGVRSLFGKKQTPLVITSADRFAPTQCGLCDGSIMLHGLTPNEPVTVDYSLNGAQPTEYAATVQPDGAVKIANLSAGNYTGVTAKIKRKKAATADIMIAAPVMTISNISPINPTVKGTCDGSAAFNGLYAGKNVTVNYNLNGAPQPAFSGIVNAGNSVNLTGLCEGTYTNIVASIGTCTANGKDFTLVAPAPVEAPKPLPETDASTTITRTRNGENISAPILFDFDKSTIHKSSYAELNEAAREMKKDKKSTITIDAYTDKIGTKEYNQALSVRRAEAVKDYLTKKGISPRRLKIKGYGEKYPVAPNNTAEGRREDRRATMELKK